MKINNLGLSQAWLIVIVVILTAFVSSSAAYWYQGYRNAAEIDALKAQLAGFENQIAQLELDKDAMTMKLEEMEGEAMMGEDEKSMSQSFDFSDDLSFEYPAGWHIYHTRSISGSTAILGPNPITFVSESDSIYPVTITSFPPDGTAEDYLNSSLNPTDIADQSTVTIDGHEAIRVELGENSFGGKQIRYFIATPTSGYEVNLNLTALGLEGQGLTDEIQQIIDSFDFQ